MANILNTGNNSRPCFSISQHLHLQQLNEIWFNIAKKGMDVFTLRRITRSGPNDFIQNFQLTV